MMRDLRICLLTQTAPAGHGALVRAAVTATAV